MSFRNASFNKTFAGRLTVSSAAALGTYSLCDMGGLVM